VLIVKQPAVPGPSFGRRRGWEETGMSDSSSPDEPAADESLDDEEERVTRDADVANGESPST
jgi:hypothetical protein